MEIRLRLLFDNTQTHTNMHTHSSRSGMAVKHTHKHMKTGGRGSGTERRAEKVVESQAAKELDQGGTGLKERAMPFWNDQQMT